MQIMFALAFLLVGQVAFAQTSGSVQIPIKGITDNGGSYTIDDNAYVKSNVVVVAVIDLSRIESVDAGSVTDLVKTMQFTTNGHLNDDSAPIIIELIHGARSVADFIDSDYSSVGATVETDFFANFTATWVNFSMDAKPEFISTLNTAITDYRADATKQFLFYRMRSSVEYAAKVGGLILDFTTEEGIQANKAPILEDIGTVIAKKDKTTNIVLHATDLEDDAASLELDFSTTVLPAGITYNKHAHYGDMLIVDGSIAVDGEIDVIVKDSEGAIDTKKLTLVIDSSEDFISADGFQNKTYVEESTTVQVTFDVVPNGRDIDAVVAMSSGDASGYGDLAWIIRFNSDGEVDAHDGLSPGKGTYKSENAFAYTSGTSYTVVVDVDVAGLKYSASVTPEGGSATVIATDYGFRVDITTLNTLAISASNKSHTVSNILGLTIPNIPPVLAPIGTLSEIEGVVNSFSVSATDADGDDTGLRFSVSGTALPTGVTFTDNLDGTAKFDFDATTAVSNTTGIIVSVTDGEDPTVEDITIDITAANIPPILNPIGTLSEEAGVINSFSVSATDADGDNAALRFSVSGTALPTGVTFTDNLDGTAKFDFDATTAVSNTTGIIVSVTDGEDAAIEDITIDITAANIPPVLNLIGTLSEEAGVVKSFIVTATDADGDDTDLRFSISGTVLPTGVTFTDNLDGTAKFDFDATTTVATTTGITVTVTDGADTDEEDVTVEIRTALNIEEGLLMNDFKVYPNPTVGGEFSVALPQSTQDITVELFDVNGRIIESAIVTGKKHISKVNLESGVYIVKISTSKFELSKKLMVK